MKLHLTLHTILDLDQIFFVDTVRLNLIPKHKYNNNNNDNNNTHLFYIKSKDHAETYIQVEEGWC